MPGPCLGDAVTDPVRERIWPEHDEQVLVLTELRVEADLELGRHADVIGELTALTAEHPLRERLVSQLMLALYRSGRQPEALGVARAFRAVLADDHGLDPRQEFLDLERDILNDDRSLLPGVAARPVGPVQLPPAIADFTGRQAEVAWLDALLTDAEHGISPPVLITTIAGTGGIGKPKPGK